MSVPMCLIREMRQTPRVVACNNHGGNFLPSISFLAIGSTFFFSPEICEHGSSSFDGFIFFLPMLSTVRVPIRRDGSVAPSGERSARVGPP